MRGVSVCLLVGLLAEWSGAQFLNNRPFPTYSLENMPDTEFTCRDKILGGYYADAETQCQMFHVCVKVAGVGIQDFRFLCPNGTAFDQDHQICAEWEDVDCDATTLYYSSDNFDLYRLGSGFESKAVKYGEDEETFALQRAETGDARLNREHQAQRVNQQKDTQSFKAKNRVKANRNQDNQNNNNERDIFKGSSSSNFFNNRNNGKETDEDYDDNVNANQDRDFTQKRKNVRTKQHRRPVAQNNRQEEKEAQTSRPQRPTGFTNNFAGSVPTTARPTSTTINSEQYSTAVNNYRSRQKQRVHQNRQYNDADNFRSTNSNSSPAPSFTISTPAPFRQTQPYNNSPRSYNNGQYYSTTPAPRKAQTENYPQTTIVQQQQQKKIPSGFNGQFDNQKVKNVKNENYPTTQFEVTKTKVQQTTPGYVQSPKTENYPSNNPNYFDKKSTVAKQQQNNDYPTTFSPKNKPNQYNKRPSDYPTTFAPKTNSGYTQISQQTVQYSKPTTTQFNNNNNNYNQGSTQNFNQETRSPNFDNQRGNTQSYNQGANTQNFNNQGANTQNYNNQGGNTQNYNNQAGNTQSYNNQGTNTQNFNTQTTQSFKFNQQQNFNQQSSTQNFNQNQNKAKQTTPRTTPFTQYTPTVPKVTSTTPVSRSNRFDETQYDDGSYNPKYDYDGDKKDEEFLKTAHSQNIASSRNEYEKTNKQSNSKPYYESPRPFSISPNTPQTTSRPTTQTYQPTQNHQQTRPQQQQRHQQQSQTQPPRQQQNNQQQQRPQENNQQTNQQKPVKSTKTKDVSYDYAYYDSSVGTEPDYVIDTEFKKSTVKN